MQEDRLGLTQEQWERFQAYTQGYGDQDENGVDLSLLRAKSSSKNDFGVWGRISSSFQARRLCLPEPSIVVNVPPASKKPIILSGSCINR